MESLRKRMSVFFIKNRDRGLRNLMLYVAIGNVVVWFFSMIDPSNMLYFVLRFDSNAILRGQIWRLVSYIFTYLIDANGFSLILGMLTLLCYFYIGRTLEQIWGVLKFNLYYLFGILIPDILALLIGYPLSAYYLDLSLFLAIATLIPEQRFYIFFVIPIKVKYLAWLDIGLILFEVIPGLFDAIVAGAPFVVYLYILFPLFSLLNYFLFLGRDFKNLIPSFLLHGTTKTQRSFRSSMYQDAVSRKSAEQKNQAYRHKCTVCGRTDLSDPDLEFRYCSKCNGFYCYCEDHINSHVHIVSTEFNP